MVLSTKDQIKELVLYQKPDSLEYRDGQLETVVDILYGFLVEKYKYVILDAPTGTGKSIIAKSVSDVLNSMFWEQEHSSLFLTKTINLQHQYTNDFKDMKLLMSSSNYDCFNEKSPVLAIDSIHQGCVYNKSSGNCLYNKARDEFEESNTKILNYSFFFTGLFKYNNSDTLICDEAHNLEESIIDFSTIQIELEELKVLCKFHGIDITVNHEDDITFNIIEQLLKLYDIIAKFYTEKIQHINSAVKSGIEVQGKKLNLETLSSKLADYESRLGSAISILKLLYLVHSSGSLDNWVTTIESPKDGGDFLRIKSIFIDAKLNDLIFERPKRVLLMSATSNRVKESLKLTDKECKVLSTEYLYDLDNRKIFSVAGTSKLNYSTKEKVIPEYIDICDKIIGMYDDKANILVHSSSYWLSEEILKASKLKDRIVIPKSSEEIMELEENLKPDSGKIIVSPAMLEGVNLPGGIVKCQIIFKLPYASLGDAWVKLKTDRDEGWYKANTLFRVIQASGRIIRGPSDKGEMFILDSSFNYLINNTKKYTPNWWYETIKSLDKSIISGS